MGLECFKPPYSQFIAEHIVKTRVLSREARDGARESAFLINSQAMLLQLYLEYSRKATAEFSEEGVQNLEDAWDLEPSHVRFRDRNHGRGPE